MSRFKVLYKLSQDGIITGMVCQIDNRGIKCIRKNNFSKVFTDYQCINAKLSADNKILSSGSEIQTLEINTSDRILYHGSKGGLVGHPRAGVAREFCDFGRGFYTGTDIEQARGIISQVNNGVVYTLYCKTSDLRVYHFKSSTEWALYVGVHRQFIQMEGYPKLRQLVKYIDEHDVVVGAIADDRMQSIFPSFMRGDISDRVLTECLKAIKLGDQWVFNNDKACRNILVIGNETISAQQSRIIKERQNATLNTITTKVEQVKKLYRRSGKFVDEILEEYR